MNKYVKLVEDCNTEVTEEKDEVKFGRKCKTCKVKKGIDSYSDKDNKLSAICKSCVKKAKKK
jgi:hypothetical protein